MSSVRPYYPQLDLRLDAHRAPGSVTSSEAAEIIEAGAKLQHERWRVLTWFASQGVPRTRHECAAILYPVDGGIGSACGRVNDLVHAGWLEEVGRQGKRATLAITAAGRRRLSEAA